jgi:2-keto-4-pentenoate hydratase/2-oxohepta-3-ene-1,7-dioic acid hydratase in catechol pathway
MKIICIGRNYRDHIKEFDGGEDPREPLFFFKPDTALLRNNDPFYIPDFTQEVEYECELIVRINRLARHVATKFAHRLYAEVGLGIDFTARDLQREARRRGEPWECAKGFDYSAAVSPQFIPLVELGDVQQLHFTLELNGEVRQQGYTGDMIFSVDELLSHVSRYVTFRMGDLLFTGTPAGVGRVVHGDRLRATLEGHELLNFEIR